MKCSRKTKIGKKCKNKARYGFKTCGVHKRKLKRRKKAKKSRRKRRNPGPRALDMRAKGWKGWKPTKKQIKTVSSCFKECNLPHGWGLSWYRKKTAKGNKYRINITFGSSNAMKNTHASGNTPTNAIKKACKLICR